MLEERREFTRVCVHVHAEITFLDEEKIQADSFDLSMKGISIEGGSPSHIGKVCSVAISLNAPPEVLQVRSAGVVAQFREGRMGILFNSIEMESFEHLRNLILYNAADEGKVEEELQNHLGLKQTTG